MNCYANSEERDRLTAGLRELAYFLDRNPNVPAPLTTVVYVFPPDGSDAEMFAEIDVIAGSIGVTASGAGSRRGHHSAARYFGPVEYRAIAIPRSARGSESGKAE